MSQSNCESVKKYRAKLATEDCARMEVTLQKDLINQTLELARETRRPLWEVVEAALIAYVAGHLPKMGSG